MVRRFGLVSLVVVVVAFAGASAGPGRSLESLRLVASYARLNTPEEVEQEKARPSDARATGWSISTASRLPRSAGFRRPPVERWLFQRPPPALI